MAMDPTIMAEIMTCWTEAFTCRKKVNPEIDDSAKNKDDLVLILVYNFLILSLMLKLAIIL